MTNANKKGTATHSKLKLKRTQGGRVDGAERRRTKAKTIFTILSPLPQTDLTQFPVKYNNSPTYGHSKQYKLINHIQHHGHMS